MTIRDMTADEHRQFIADHMTEDELDTLIQQAAHTHGWLTDHFRPARTNQGWKTAIKGDKGGPDRRLVHPNGYVILAELKTQRGRLSPDQQRWAEALECADIRACFLIEDPVPVFRWFVWRPIDWLNGTITRELGRHPL